MVHNEQLLPKTKQNLLGFMEKMTFISKKKECEMVYTFFSLGAYNVNIAISAA